MKKKLKLKGHFFPLVTERPLFLSLHQKMLVTQRPTPWTEVLDGTRTSFLYLSLSISGTLWDSLFWHWKYGFLSHECTTWRNGILVHVTCTGKYFGIRWQDFVFSHTFCLLEMNPGDKLKFSVICYDMLKLQWMYFMSSTFITKYLHIIDNMFSLPNILSSRKTSTYCCTFFIYMKQYLSRGRSIDNSTCKPTSVIL